MLSDLLKYKNRQTIINEYKDEELVKREGIFFDEMNTIDQSIKFIKDGTIRHQIELPNKFTIRKDSSFSNFFTIEWNDTKIEIYFP
ncbi:hypothetical protein ACFSO7_12485 [Bacillus sp. CGMCC 1.16607]|uniref:hypothetical protein n=1 Tax=Bacillus sp. CGMCC 1.16607 TaxID=3351842 RepID=UPI00363B4198